MANESFSKFIEWVVEKCENARVGYSQDYREGQWTTAYSKDTAYTNGQSVQYYDCSSLVYYALGAAGFSIGSYAFNTSDDSEGSWLLNHGWKAVNAGGTYQQGDIGKTSGKGHTEICYKGGSGCGLFMGAHGRNRSDGGGTVPLPNQVSIGQYDSSGQMKSESNSYRSFAKLYRYSDWDGSEPSPTPSEPQFSFYVAAAIAGNFWQESHINPGIWENLHAASFTGYWKSSSESGYGYSIGGYGLGGWTNVKYSNGGTSDRLKGLYEYLTNAGYAVDSGDGQVAYLKVENSWQTTGTEEYEHYGALFPSLTAFFESESTDLTELTHGWNRCWEGIHDSSWDTRVTYAQTAYNYITAHYNDDSITDWIVGNKYLTDSEKENNAVMLYRALNSFYGNGDVITNPSGNSGDGGESGGTSQFEQISFEDFLYAMMAKSNNGMYLPIHVIKDRRK